MVLVDLALGLMILAGALFLGSVALRLFKESDKSDKKDNNV